MRTPHALVRACRPTTTPRSRPSRLLSRLLARLPPGEPDETVHSPSTRLAVAPTTEPAAGRSTRTPWRTPRHASHYAAMTTQHSAHPPLPSAASLSLSISPLSFASTSLASFVPRLQWRAHKGCLGSDVSGTWWERTLTPSCMPASDGSAVGIDYVLVNGQVVLKGTEHSGALPGMALRRPAA